MGLLMVLVWSQITAGDGLGDGVVDRQIEGDQRHSPLTIDRLISHDIPTNLNCPSQPITTCSNISDFTICWGYEKGCTKEDRLFLPYCDGPPSPWGKTIDDKMELFWKQGDFGYVKDVVDSLIMLCKPKQKDGASLVCSTNMRYCRAENFYLDLRRFNEFANREGDTYKSFRENIFQLGEVGGYCDLDKRLLNDQGEHKSPLQSWYAELEEYTGLYHDPILMNECDQIVTKPTVFIKLDAGINLYHHYCDFFNLYASQHVNNSFDKDINIVIWDTSYSIYRDLFVETWQAFTSNPVQRLADFAMKRVCFKDVMFPLLARMRGGLYYNTYIVPHCYRSGLMQSFSKHLIDRLNITQELSDPETVRVTLLKRTTRHRRINNEDEVTCDNYIIMLHIIT
jgi:protein O-GlcNAc transferase